MSLNLHHDVRRPDLDIIFAEGLKAMTRYFQYFSFVQHAWTVASKEITSLTSEKAVLASEDAVARKLPGS